MSTKLPCPSEYQEQVTLVHWLRMMDLAHWRTPSETYTTSWKQKTSNKALGVVPGIPDLFVVVPSVGLLGVEMKRVKGSVTSQAQKDWIALLNTLPGIEARVCYGAEDAIKFIESYLPKQKRDILHTDNTMS